MHCWGWQWGEHGGGNASWPRLATTGIGVSMGTEQEISQVGGGSIGADDLFEIFLSSLSIPSLL